MTYALDNGDFGTHTELRCVAAVVTRRAAAEYRQIRVLTPCRLRDVSNQGPTLRRQCSSLSPERKPSSTKSVDRCV